MKKIILIVVVLGLIAAFLAIRQKKKDEEKAAKAAAQAQGTPQSGNYVGVNTPSGQYGVDVDQVSSVWGQLSNLFGRGDGNSEDYSSANNMSPVNCAGMTPEERTQIQNSEVYKCS